MYRLLRLFLRPSLDRPGNAHDRRKCKKRDRSAVKPPTAVPWLPAASRLNARTAQTRRLLALGFDLRAGVGG